MNPGKVMTVEERLPAVDGSQRTYLATRGPIYNTSGQVMRFIQHRGTGQVRLFQACPEGLADLGGQVYSVDREG